MVQGVPDDNKQSTQSTSDTPTNTETVEEVTQPTEPITDVEPSKDESEKSAEPIAADIANIDETLEPVTVDESSNDESVEPIAIDEQSKDESIEVMDADVLAETPTDEPTAPIGTLHLLSYLLWEREGISTFEVTRADLLDTITTLIEQLKSSTDAGEQLKHVILGGQTVLIEDIAAVRSDLIALLAIYNAGGRFGIGPWYIQVDNVLVSGESLIRNLLLGRNDVTRHGIDLVNIAFMPALVEHISQLPQILSGFDITAMMMTSPEAVLSLPFRWVAPDGSHILVVNHHDGADISKAIEDQKFGQPDGPFLWLNSINESTDLNISEMNSVVKHPILQSTLADYFDALRQGLPDTLRPALKGELRLMGPGYQVGRLSTRMYLKQANSRLQTLLTYQTEPWLAIALTNGQLKSPQNVRALLDYGWRELMKNQSRNNLSGCSDDTVTQETEIRNQRILDVTQRIQDVSLDALPGTLTRTMSIDEQKATREETYIGVWNSHSFTAEQVVEINLMLPDGKYPETLTDPDGREIDFSWDTTDDADYSCVLGFRAKGLAVGYTVYTLKLGDNKPQYTVRTNKAQAIAKTNGETLLVEKGELVWSRPNRRITDFLSFHDGGDAGDTYNYEKPQPDVSVRAGMTDMVTVESTPTYERLIFRERMRIAPELKDDLSRTRGLSLLDITTTATVYDGMPGIYFRTTFTNKAKDHRLRAHFRTGLKASEMLTDTAFGLTSRKIVSDSTHVAAQPQVNIFPLQTLASVTGEEETLVLMTRGLTEVEPIIEKDEVTLALTLLRSVGWLKRGDDTTHGIPAKGAQYERDVVVEYAILPMPIEDKAAMLRAAQTYTAPLQAFQYHEKPDPLQQNYLSFDNDKVVMTALKPPQTGEGWIVRFINPTNEEASGKLTTHSKLKSAKLVNLAEEDKAEYTITQNTINLNIEPQKIHTIRLEFN